jgi:hypothetical protein
MQVSKSHYLLYYEVSFINYSYEVPVTIDKSPMSIHCNSSDQLGNTGTSASKAQYQDLEADGIQLGKEELNLLMAQLLGTQAEQKQGLGGKEVIRLNLFCVEEEES